MTSVISTEQKAHLIRHDQEAISIAHALAAEFNKEAPERDQQRQLFPQRRQPTPPSLAVERAKHGAI